MMEMIAYLAQVVVVFKLSRSGISLCFVVSAVALKPQDEEGRLWKLLNNGDVYQGRRRRDKYIAVAATESMTPSIFSCITHQCHGV